MRALDIGSGHNPVRDSGWLLPHDTDNLHFTNMDGFWLAVDKTDVHHDFNQLPWPFQGSTFDVVFARHTLEHVRRERLIDVMKEIYRVSKNGATVHIRVPYWNSESFAGDPTHWNPFCETTFKHFCQGGGLGTEYYVPQLFRMVRLEFRFQSKFRFIPRRLLKELMHILCGVCDEMWVTLEVIKPAPPAGAVPYKPQYRYGWTTPLAVWHALLYGELFWGFLAWLVALTLR